MQPDPYTHMISLIYSNKLFLCKTARFTVSQGTYLLFWGSVFPLCYLATLLSGFGLVWFHKVFHCKTNSCRCHEFLGRMRDREDKSTPNVSGGKVLFWKAAYRSFKSISYSNSSTHPVFSNHDTLRRLSAVLSKKKKKSQSLHTKFLQQYGRATHYNYKQTI